MNKITEALSTGVQALKESRLLQLALLALVLGLITLRIIKSVQKGARKSAARKVEDEAERLGIDPEMVSRDAQTIYSAMTFGNVWDPNTWGENDPAIYAVVREYDEETFPLLSDAYFEISRRKRDLRADLIEFLDDRYLDEVGPIFNYYG